MGLFVSNARKGGWIRGAALAIWLIISMEGLPLAAWVFLILALVWLFYRRGGEDGVRLESATIAFTVS